MKMTTLSLLLYLTMFAGSYSLGARTLYLSTSDDDSAAHEHGEAEFRTLQRAVDSLIPGDTLIVRNGVYNGGVRIRITATADAPVLIRGESLDAVILGNSDDLEDGLRIEKSSYLTIDRLSICEASHCGIFITESDHFRLTRCRLGGIAGPNLMTGFVDHFHAEDNEFFGSRKSHGLYHSNSGDHFVIRRNIVHHNYGNGIHLNGDPEIEGGDGVLNFGTVEDNIIFGNGLRGGGGINMTHVHDVLVRNNLIYSNYNQGMTVYQDVGPFEQGSKRVVILGNTLYYLPLCGQSCINVQTTSEKVLIAGNIIVSGGIRPVLEINSDHLGTVRSDFNILWGMNEREMIERKEKRMSFDDWRSLSGNGSHSKVADPRFVDAAAGDFMLTGSSPALDAGIPPDSLRAILDRLGGFEWILGLLDGRLQDKKICGWREP
jgi:Right handed beta helix region